MSKAGAQEKCSSIGARTMNTKPLCVYSLRAKEEPTVSTPVTWSEVENCLKKKRAELLRFRSDQALARVENRATCSSSGDTQTKAAGKMDT